jgi:urease accessory protein
MIARRTVDRDGPTYPTGDAGGLLDLEFTRNVFGRTVLRARKQRFPLRTTTPFYLDAAAPDMAFVYVQNPTGGVFGGDRLLTRLNTDVGARVHLTTQSATKLYRTDAHEARQELHFELAAGAYVESMPDALIPHAGSRYRQHTCVTMRDGAIFVGGETIAPGRRAFGERFAYEMLELTIEVALNGREICAETLRFEPGRALPNRAGVLGDRDYLISMLVIAPERDAAALAAAIDGELADADAIRGAAGELPNGAGAVVRMFAPCASAADRALRCGWGAARRALLGLPLPERRK